MTLDPKPRVDGSCATCSKRRPATIGKQSQRNRRERLELEAMLAADPFCSATCCRKWHGFDVNDQQQHNTRTAT